MLKKIIVTGLLTFGFVSNASALTSKGKFNKITHKIEGGWILVEVKGRQIIAFDEDFKTENGPDLKIFLSKKRLRKLKKDPTFINPITLASLKDISGKQHYILPSNINIEDYKSIVIHSEESNLIWGGFNLPRDRALDNRHTIINVIENNEGAIRVGL